MLHRPHVISPKNFELWTGRIELRSSLGAAAVQAIVTEYVTGSGITVVGYYTPKPAAFTMLRWPDDREGYRAPSPEACDIALAALAAHLGSNRFESGIVPDNKIHVMMGRKMGGYGKGEIAPISMLQARLPGRSITDGCMVSARTTGTGVESYGVEDDEQVGVIIADPSDIEAVHHLGDELMQHHYAIEHGARGNESGETTFWETRWSPTYVMNSSDS